MEILNKSVSRIKSDVLSVRSPSLQLTGLLVSCKERLFLYLARARAAAAKNRSGVKEGGQLETEGGVGREHFTVNIGQQLSVSFLSLTEMCK